MKTIAFFCLLLVLGYCWGCATPSRSSSSYQIGGVPKEDRTTEIMATVFLGTLAIVLLVAVEEAKKEKARKITAVMESWDGASIARLIRAWGPYQQVVSDGSDGRIYIWTTPIDITLEQGSIQVEGKYKEDGYTEDIQINPPVKIEYNRVRMFWVNSRGIIYHWKWRGL